MLEVKEITQGSRLIEDKFLINGLTYILLVLSAVSLLHGFIHTPFSSIWFL